MSWDINDAKKEIKCKCKEILETKPKVVLSEKAMNQIKTMLKFSPKKEWMAGLVGTELKEGELWVQELKLYEQECAGSTVSLTTKGDEEMAKTQNILGWIHSHVDMKAFASCTDDDTDFMYRLGITVNNALEFCTRVMVKVPCGGVEKVYTDTLVEGDFKEDETLIGQAKELLKEKTYEYHDQWDYRGGYGTYGYGDHGQYGQKTEDKKFYKVNLDVACTTQGWVLMDKLGNLKKALTVDDCTVCGNRMGKGDAKRKQCEICLEEVHRSCMDSKYDGVNGGWHYYCHRCWNEGAVEGYVMSDEELEVFGTKDQEKPEDSDFDETAGKKHKAT